MGKEKPGFLTPKAISNRIKAKGLQKLRWYCQMCQKQCRDENGFKCHMTSESHQRQLLLFAENPDEYVDTFSNDFSDGYCELLRRRFGTKRVHANIVYQEYITNRDHVHMNSSMWETLTDFVKWLGKEGKCMVDNTEKGWFVQWIDRDPEAIRRQEAMLAKEKMDLDDEERTSRFIQQQIVRAADSAKHSTVTEFTDLQRRDDDDKVTFNIPAPKKEKSESRVMPSQSKQNVQTSKNSTALQVNSTLTSNMSQTSHPPPSSHRSSSLQTPASSTLQKVDKSGRKGKFRSALDEIMKTEEEMKEKCSRTDYWLCKNIVVKVVLKKLGEKYYRQKAVVTDVIDLYVGIIKMLNNGDTLKVDQTHVETVIPAIGKRVLVLNGAYRGEVAILEGLREDEFCCSIRLSQGVLRGRLVKSVTYEDISKLHVP